MSYTAWFIVYLFVGVPLTVITLGAWRGVIDGVRHGLNSDAEMLEIVYSRATLYVMTSLSLWVGFVTGAAIVGLWWLVT
jgi:hypothetical protein